MKSQTFVIAWTDERPLGPNKVTNDPIPVIDKIDAFSAADALTQWRTQMAGERAFLLPLPIPFGIAPYESCEGASHLYNWSHECLEKLSKKRTNE